MSISANFHPSDPQRFQKAIRRFDTENAKDPHQETVNGVNHPRELLYAKRLSDWVLKLSPNASETLQLAARCQHLCRWMIPRNSYKMNRTGYLRWRNDLKQFHAHKAGEILHEVGYPEDIITRVQELNLKKNFPKDSESRVLEDALCLVFLQYQLAEFISQKEEEKITQILQKTWGKMTPAAHAQASAFLLGSKEKTYLEHALVTGTTSEKSSRSNNKN